MYRAQAHAGSRALSDQRRSYRRRAEWAGRPAFISVQGSLRDAAFFFALVHRSQEEEFTAALRFLVSHQLCFTQPVGPVWN